MSKLDELKQEAKELGIEHSAQIGEKKLQEKIDAHYESLEKSEDNLAKAVQAVEQAAEQEANAKDTIAQAKRKRWVQIRKQLEADARKTRVVTITDNDNRVNNNTTTCSVNCSNAYFDLGTKVLPLNEKIEIYQGHINVLKEVKIPMHTKNPKTGLAQVRMRPRYSIHYEDV